MTKNNFINISFSPYRTIWTELFITILYFYHNFKIRGNCLLISPDFPTSKNEKDNPDKAYL